MSVTREQVVEALQQVLDPELGISVVDLGLIYDLAIDAGRVHVTMTLTAQGCALHESMAEWIRRAVAQIPGVDEVLVTIVFDPPWTPDRIRQGALR